MKTMADFPELKELKTAFENGEKIDMDKFRPMFVVHFEESLVEAEAQGYVLQDMLELLVEHRNTHRDEVLNQTKAADLDVDFVADCMDLTIELLTKRCKPEPVKLTRKELKAKGIAILERREVVEKALRRRAQKTA